jgi:hypothetical protein
VKAAPWIIVVLLIATLWALTSRRGSTAAGVVTFADYFELGERNVKSLFDGRSEKGDEISATLAERAERAVVRVHIKYDVHDGAFSTATATGTVVDDGRYVVSVAHELQQLMARPDASIQFVLGDGRVLAGKKPDLEHYDAHDTTTDWSLLEIVDPPAGLPSLDLGDAPPGERLVLGFPGRYGRDSNGTPRLDDPFEPAALRPLRIVCRTLSDDLLQLELVAGCVPMGGISGAPCVDPRGKLVAIQRAYTDVLKDGHGRATLNVVPNEGVRSAIARLHAGK